MSNRSQKLSIGEKIGYSLGDLSANLIFQTLVTFISFYYTDAYKIPAATASTIIFSCGIIAAFFNPVMGAIADRTQSRWGKFRPWILWTSVPFGVMAMITFTTPDFGMTGKIIYAVITYFLLLILYAANNLPYAALSGVLTGDMAERNSISSYRFVAVMIAQFIIQVLLYPLVLIVGNGDKAVGFEKTMTVFAIVGAIFLLITFLTTRERIVPKPDQKSTVREDLLDLSKNIPWIVMLVVTILIFVNLSLKGGMYIYYFDNYVDEVALSGFLEGIGFNNMIAGLNIFLRDVGLSGYQWPDDPVSSGFSLFNAGGIIFMIVGIGFSKSLADKFGKRDVFGIALFLSTLCILVFLFYSPESTTLIFVSYIIHGFTYGVTIPLLWAMIADVADYSEWKNNRRATAIIFSAMIFGLKAGLTIGGALVAGILAMYDYSIDLAVQNPETVNGIKLSVSVYASIPFFLAVGCLFFYEINKKMEVQIEQELGERRKDS
jgi:GPH family glycoside/pentoside/hexuronide:cation symporter